MSKRINDSSTSNVALPQSLDGQLRGFRRRLRILKLVEVVFAAIAGLMFAYLLVFVVERWFAMPTLIRAACLIVGTIGFSLALPLALRKWFWNTRRLEQVARLLRQAFPVLGDEILSVIEMADRRAGQGASPRLVAAATEQTCARVAKRDLSSAAPTGLAKRRSVIALTLAAATIALMVIVPSAAGNSWLRLLNPWTNAPRFTFTKIGDLPNELVVPYGESFQLAVPLAGESEWRPSSATAMLGSSNVSADLEDDTYQFSMPAQTNQAKLEVKVGDNRRSLNVLPMTRPELTSITATTLLPEYLQYPEPIEQTTTSHRFNAIVGSQIAFDFLANREIEAATLDGQSIHASGQHVSTDALVVNESQNHTVNWSDVCELQPRKPIELTINATQDQTPLIIFENIKERVLLVSKSLRFDFNSHDDFGIKKIGMEWTGQSSAAGVEPVRGEKLLFAGNPRNRAVNEQGIFTPLLENVAPQILTLRLFVEDYLPSRERIYSRPQTIHVMSPDEHVGWIHDKMQRWKSAADAIYEREIGLAEENQNLRRLDSQERQSPENIRRMENQVAAERDNAQRLEQTVDQGRKLIQEAMANENLRAQQVAQWADSLAKLQDIAKMDMPGIADQLSKVTEDLKNQSKPGKNAGRQPSTDDESKPPSNQDDDSESQKDEGSQDPALKAGGNRLEQKPGASKTENEDEGKEEGKEKDDGSKVPKVEDVEDSMLKQEPGKSADGGGSQPLDLPETNLLNPKMEEQEKPPGEEEKEEEEKPKPPAEPSLDGLVEDHEKLLEEFKKARDAMDEIMAEFENSTFVKRFKSAARTQLDLASRLNQLIPRSFGSQNPEHEVSKPKMADLSSRQQLIFESLQQLNTDLKAYQAREPEDARQAILDEMDSLKMQVKLEELPQRIQKNRLGDSLHRSEFWADTFDRWAEELVPPVREGGGGGGEGGGGGSKPSLPPAIVLDVMRQIEAEMNLRDETRGFDQSRAAMAEQERQERNDGLTVYQMANQERSLDTIEDIKQLPGGEQSFASQLGKLSKAANAMNEATGMLFDRTTGDPTIAAESAAIEALLASGRADPMSSKDQSENDTGQDGSESLTNPSAAMNMLSPGSGQSGRPQIRSVGAGTAASSDNVPERFRNGIDNFTNRLGRLRNQNK